MAEDTSTISSSNSDCLNSSLSESSDNDSDDICFDLLGNSINELSDENFRLYFRVNRIVAEEIIGKFNVCFLLCLLNNLFQRLYRKVSIILQ